MTDNKKSSCFGIPSCFGIIDTVFPKNKEGIRTTPESCLVCSYKTDCLKAVMEGPDGLKLREEFIDRAYDAGMINFLERWSRKKDLQRRIIETKIRGGK